MKHSEIIEDFKSPYMEQTANCLNILKMSQAERNIYRASRNETLKERDYIVSAEAKGEALGKAERNVEIAKNLRKLYHR